MKKRRLSGWLAVLPCALALMLTGCGSSKPTGTVSGKVTFQGEPITEGEVLLVSDDKTNGGTAKLDSSGTFKISQPVPVGNYTVCVTPPPLEMADDPSQVQPPQSKIPDRYYSELTSDLKREIKEGENMLEIELTPGSGVNPMQVAP